MIAFGWATGDASIGMFFCLMAVPKNRKRIKRFDDLMSGVGSMSEIAKRTVD